MMPLTHLTTHLVTNGKKECVMQDSTTPQRDHAYCAATDDGWIVVSVIGGVAHCPDVSIPDQAKVEKLAGWLDSMLAAMCAAEDATSRGLMIGRAA